MTSTMNSTMNSHAKSYNEGLLDSHPCIVERVFFSFLYDIAVIHLHFTIIKFFFTIIYSIIRCILRLRYICQRMWIMDPIVWLLYLKIWYYHTILFLCRSKHWARKQIPKLVELVAWGVRRVGSGIVDGIRGVAIRCPAVLIGMVVIEAERKLIVDVASSVATDVKEAVRKSIVYMAEFIEDAAEVLKELHDAGSITEDNQVWTLKKKESVKRDMAKKEMKKEMKKETSRPCAASKPNSKLDGRTNASVAATYLKTDLENYSNRNWSNEHGNLSPGSSPSRRLTQIYDSGLLYPSPFVQVSHSGPKSLPSSGTGSTIHTPTSTTSPSTGEIYTPNSSDTTFASSSEEGQTPSASSSSSSSSSGSIKTPSESSFSSGGIKTPSGSSASSDPVNTPSASGSPSGGVRSPPSTSDTDSEDGSLSGTPTSTFSSGSISTGVDTSSP